MEKSTRTHSVPTSIHRRYFMKMGAAGIGAAVLHASAGNDAHSATASRMTPGILGGKDGRTVRLGFIGVGLRGRSQDDLALRREDTQVVAICDIDPDAISATQEMIHEAGRPEAAVYSDGELAYTQLLEREDVDGVVIASPWLLHTRMTVAAMRAGLCSR